MWRSCWPSGACAPITSPSGGGSNVTPQKFSADCDRLTIVGGWTKPTSVRSTGATIDFLLSAKRDTVVARRFLAKALGGANHPHPRVINSDKHAAYPPAITVLQAAGDLADNCQHRPVQYLNSTIAGYEAIHMIRKGQACCSGAGVEVGLLNRLIVGMFGIEA